MSFLVHVKNINFIELLVMQFRNCNDYIIRTPEMKNTWNYLLALCTTEKKYFTMQSTLFPLIIFGIMTLAIWYSFGEWMNWHMIKNDKYYHMYTNINMVVCVSLLPQHVLYNSLMVKVCWLCIIWLRVCNFNQSFRKMLYIFIFCVNWKLFFNFQEILFLIFN